MIYDVSLPEKYKGLFSEEEWEVWVNTPHSGLDNVCPLDLILLGQEEVVWDLIEDALLGHPS